MNKEPMKIQGINERLMRMLKLPQEPSRPKLLQAMRMRRLMGMKPRGRGGVSFRPTEIKMQLPFKPGATPVTPKPRFPFGRI